jgi:hypothetical protein
VLGAKNLLKNTATSQTINGVTFTVNSDGSITANGTATNDATLSIAASRIKLQSNTSYILSGCPTGGSFSTFNLSQNVTSTDSSTDYFGFPPDNGNGSTFTTGDAQLWYQASVRIRKGVTVSDLTFYPMLRLASDPDDTYVPYAMTNRELTEKKINIADLKTVVSASSDFTDFKTRIASL